MTSRACQQALDNVAGGVGAALRAVDCAAAEMAQAQAAGDSGSYETWAEIHDAVAALQASSARTANP